MGSGYIENGIVVGELNEDGAAMGFHGGVMEKSELQPTAAPWMKTNLPEICCRDHQEASQ